MSTALLVRIVLTLVVAGALAACGAKVQSSTGSPTADAAPEDTSQDAAPGGQMSDASATDAQTHWSASDGGVTPGDVVAMRYASICGVPNPPFTDDDLFTLVVLGRLDSTPRTELHFELDKVDIREGVPMTLGVEPFSPPTGGDGSAQSYGFQRAQTGRVTLDFNHGKQQAEIDTGAFDAVTATVLTMPAKDGDPFSVSIRIHFVDGKQVDEVFTAPLQSSWGGCPMP